jgi:hypothetical protein
MQRITNRGSLSYRTKCMELDAAARFARALGANERFTEVSLEESPRAKSSKRWYVQFLPANLERVADMLEREQDARAERARTQEFTFCLDKNGGRPFFWCHSATSGEVYEVDGGGRSCSCPDHLYRCQANGLKCKHVLALETAGKDAIRVF